MSPRLVEFNHVSNRPLTGLLSKGPKYQIGKSVRCPPEMIWLHPKTKIDVTHGTNIFNYEKHICITIFQHLIFRVVFYIFLPIRQLGFLELHVTINSSQTGLTSTGQVTLIFQLECRPTADSGWTPSVAPLRFPGVPVALCSFIQQPRPQVGGQPQEFQVSLRTATPGKRCCFQKLCKKNKERCSPRPPQACPCISLAQRCHMTFPKSLTLPPDSRPGEGRLRFHRGLSTWRT